MNEQQKLKSYWNRPGGKFGTVLALAGLGAIGWWVLPILTAIVWNTINFGIACVVGAVLAYCLSHRTLRLSAMYFYEILMKSLVGLVISVDPFIIAEDLIQDMKRDREKLKEQTLTVEQQKEALNAKIRERERDVEKQDSKLRAAQVISDQLAIGNASRQIGRNKEYLMQITPMRDAIAKVAEHLGKVYKNSAYLIEDAEAELSLKKDLYQTATKGRNALNQALRLFEGDPEKKLLAAQSMEFLKDDIAGKMANMKMAMSATDEFVRGIDLENATYEMEGLKRLEAVSDPGNYQLTKEGVAVPVMRSASGAPSTGLLD